jgi:hypothetical protein
MLFDLSSQAARSAKALSETMVSIQFLQDCRSRGQSAYDNVGGSGAGAMLGNVARITSRCPKFTPSLTFSRTKPPFLDFFSINSLKFPAGCSPDFKWRRTLPSVEAATVATSEHVLLNAWDDLGDIGAP